MTTIQQYVAGIELFGLTILVYAIVRYLRYGNQAKTEKHLYEFKKQQLQRPSTHQLSIHGEIE